MTRVLFTIFLGVCSLAISELRAESDFVKIEPVEGEPYFQRMLRLESNGNSIIYQSRNYIVELFLNSRSEMPKARIESRKNANWNSFCREEK